VRAEGERETRDGPADVPGPEHGHALAVQALDAARDRLRRPLAALLCREQRRRAAQHCEQKLHRVLGDDEGARAAERGDRRVRREAEARDGV
jgi:hypothetical protein